MSSLLSYAGYIIPDTRKDDIRLNSAVSAASFKKVNKVSILIDKYEGVIDYDSYFYRRDLITNLVNTSLFFKGTEDKITVEAFLDNLAYDNLRHDTANWFSGQIAYLVTDKLSIGGGASFRDWSVSGDDFTETKVNLSYKLNENYFVGLGLRNRATAGDDLEDLKETHMGIGLMSETIDAELVVLKIDGDSSKLSYRADSMEQRLTVVGHLGSIEIYGEYSHYASQANFEDYGVDNKINITQFYIAPEFEFNKNYFLGIVYQKKDTVEKQNSYALDSTKSGVYLRLDQFGKFQYKLEVSNTDSYYNYDYSVSSTDYKELNRNIHLSATYKY